VSSGSAGAEASASPPDNLSLAARLGGVVRRPRPTFEAIAAAPRPAAPLALLFLVPFAMLAVFFATDVGRQALVDQWERTAIAFGQPVDDARYDELKALSERGTAYAALTALLTGPVAAVALATLLFTIFTGVRGGAAAYGQVLGVTAYAGVILVLRHIVSGPLNYARETMASPSALVLFFTMVDEASPVARFFGIIDVFVLWWLAVLAIGLSVIYGQPMRRFATQLVGAYAAIALLLAGTMAVLGAR